MSSHKDTGNQEEMRRDMCTNYTMAHISLVLDPRQTQETRSSCEISAFAAAGSQYRHFFSPLRRLLSSSASAGHGPAITLVTHPEEPSPTSVFRPRLGKVPGIKATVGKH